MFKRYITLHKNHGMSPYIWTILYILPFYYIFQLESSTEIVVGIILTILFFAIYQIAFYSKGWLVYIWTIILIGISSITTSFFSFIYFAFFLVHFIGNIKKQSTFLILYIVHLISTTVSIYFSMMHHGSLVLKQLPFVISVWISVILLPFNIHNKNQRGQLEEKLHDANERLAELSKMEERQRIARDLHDTLGQKLSLIGLKSDLARKFINKNPEQARKELKDVQQTARTALNEVRKLVSSMRVVSLKDEIVLVTQILNAAKIDFESVGDYKLTNVNLLSENILSMCLKEAVTNIVKHSGATLCSISIEQTWKEIIMTVKDNGTFKEPSETELKGSGLAGMKERLEFVNGSLEILTDKGTTLIIRVPNDVKQSD